MVCVVQRRSQRGVQPFHSHRIRFFTAVKLQLLNIIYISSLQRLEGQLTRTICAKPTIWGVGVRESIVHQQTQYFCKAHLCYRWLNRYITSLQSSLQLINSGSTLSTKFAVGRVKITNVCSLFSVYIRS